MLNEIDNFILEKCSLRKIIIDFEENGSITICKMYNIIDND